jgi:hypothetical protein
MWLNDEVQAALLGGAVVDQPEEVREEALGALRNLARAAGNAVPMFLNDEVQAALLGGAAVDQPKAVREQALGALHNLSCAAVN